MIGKYDFIMTAFGTERLTVAWSSKIIKKFIIKKKTFVQQSVINLDIWEETFKLSIKSQFCTLITWIISPNGSRTDWMLFALFTLSRKKCSTRTPNVLMTALGVFRSLGYVQWWFKFMKKMRFCLVLMLILNRNY